MRMIFEILIIMIFVFGCGMKKDIYDSPAEINQMRLPMSINGSFEVGFAGTTNSNGTIEIQSFGEGEVKIDGQDECGYHDGKSTTVRGWVSLPLPDIDKPYCSYLVTSEPNDFQSSAIGILVIHKKVEDSNFFLMKFKMNYVLREGVNWTQVRENDNISASESKLKILSSSAIYEGYDIEIFPSGKTGELTVEGCGLKYKKLYYLENTNNSFKIGLKDIYAGSDIKGTCLFTMIANNDDTYKKDIGLALVNAYTKQGSYIEVPEVKVKKLTKKVCFEFTDPYVVFIKVNDDYTKGKNDDGTLCVDKKTTKYEVEALTSMLRIFYGICDFNGKTCTWTVK